MNALTRAYVWIVVMVTRLIRGLLVASVVALSLAAPEAKAWGAVGASVSVSFNTALSPYGEWVTVANAGRVWRPYRTVVGPDFVPYQTGGHWENSEYGWIFVSDYDWGWATFHYGRWYLDPYYGWVWVPDEVWGPSWVEWRYGGGYVGWAPLAPTFAIGFGYAYYPHYCFVETRYFTEPNWYYHRVPNYRVNDVHAATAVVPPQQVGNSRYYAGPPAGQISRETGRPIRQVEVQRPPPGRVGATRVERGNEHMITPSSQPLGQPRSQPQGYGARGQNPSQRSIQQQPGADEGGWKQFPSSGRNQSVQSQPQQMPQPWRQGEERPSTGGQLQPYQSPQQRQFGERQQPQQQLQRNEQMQSQPYQAPHQFQGQPYGAPQRQIQSQPYQAPHQFQGQPYGTPQRQFGSPYGERREPMQMQAPQYHQTQPMQSAPQYRQMPPAQIQRMPSPQMQHMPMQQPGMRGGAPVHHR